MNRLPSFGSGVNGSSPIPRMTLVSIGAWALVALAIGLMAQIAQVRETGAIEASLRVGVDAPEREIVQEDLGQDLILATGPGHDGYHYFLAARDPFALNEARHFAYPAHRHRRIFGPLLGGLGGTLSARATVFGLSAVGLVGFALTAGAIASIGRHLRSRWWSPIGAITSIGLMLSLQLVTADALATGLGLTAVALVLRSRFGLSIVGMSLAVLTKETSMLFALGMAVWLWSEGRKRQAIAVVAIPASVLLVWMSYLEIRLGNAFTARDSLDIPLRGLWTSIGTWRPGSDRLFGWIAVLSVLVAVVGVAVARHRVVSALTIPWIAIALSTGAAIWMDGNNAVRVFAPCWLLGFVGIAHAVASHGEDRSLASQ